MERAYLSSGIGLCNPYACPDPACVLCPCPHWRNALCVDETLLHPPILCCRNPLCPVPYRGLALCHTLCPSLSLHPESENEPYSC